MSVEKQRERERDDELPELPPLDDDGSLFELDPPVLETDESANMDDATLDDDQLDRFGTFAGISEEGSLLDYAEASDTLVIDEERELLASAEIGLLDDSHDGDGREITAEEAGVMDDEGSDLEDGGIEGTGEDPAGALDILSERADRSDATEDEGIDDDARFEDGSAAATRQSLERDSWPSRADAAWTIARADSVTFEGGATTDGDLVVATREGSLIISTDAGVTFTRVPGCNGVTAAAILPSERQRMVIAALHDAARESSAVVLVRVGDLVAELVADFIADDDDEDVRVESLAVRTRRVGKVETVEVLARGSFGAVLLTPRAVG